MRRATEKILKTIEDVVAWRARVDAGCGEVSVPGCGGKIAYNGAKRIGAVNGCFDILHVGHLRLLQEAKCCGVELIVGVNSDRAVRILKGGMAAKERIEHRGELLQKETKGTKGTKGEGDGRTRTGKDGHGQELSTLHSPLSTVQRPVNSEMERAELLAGLECVDAVFVFDDVRATEFLRAVRPGIWFKGSDYGPHGTSVLDCSEVAVVVEAGGRVEFVELVVGRSTTRTLEMINAQ